MSSLVKDQEVVQEGRRAPLEDVEAPLRDRLVKKLFDKLEEMEIAQRIEKVWLAGNAHRSDWLERQNTYLQQWDDHLVSEAEGPFAGSSNLHLPTTFIVSKALHARFMQAIWQDPPCHTKANNEASIERVATVQDTMRHYLLKGCNRGQGAAKALDLFIWKWVTQGSAIGKVRWETVYTRYWDVEEGIEEGPPKWAVDESGQQVRVSNPVPYEREVKRTKKCVDAPSIEVLTPEDVLIVGGAGDVDNADAILQRDFVTASTLWTAVDRKVFDKKAVEAVVSGRADSVSGALNNDLKQLQAANAGQSQIDGEEKLDRYEIIEAHMKLDIDGSGITTDVIAWVHLRTKSLLGCTFLHRVMRSGERPFFKADYHLREGQEFGVGIPELMYPIQKEIDAMHNMRIDFGLISTMPFGFYRATSGIDPETITYQPGTLIPTDNPQADVYFPQLGNRTSFGMMEEQALDGLIQRLTGINDLAMGSMASQGATRTASGARLLAGEMSSNLDVHLRRLNWGVQKCFNLVLHNLQQRIPAGVSFRLTGDDGQEYWRQVKTPEELGGAADFDIEVSPISASSNAAVRQQQSQEVLALILNPLAIQMGAVTTGNVYEALKNRLQALEVRDFGRYLTKPQGHSVQLSPLEEANRVLRGIEVPVTPEMDHEGFMAIAEQFIGDDQILGQFTEEQAIGLELQRRKHAKMMEALEAQQAQQANIQQMHMNASQSAQQAPMAQPQGPAPGPEGAPAA